jgi:hypothetical protein
MGSITVLGGGISGLATSYFVGHDKCVILEADPHYGGHVYSEEAGGCIWDDGPHVSYTKNESIKQLFSELVEGEFEEVQAEVVNFYRGLWVDHPAQSNLYQVPEPLRTRCLKSFLDSRAQLVNGLPAPVNYKEWIDQAFGPVFADTFPAAYTRKYWTREPADLGTDWIGKRVYYPKVEDVTAGAKAALGRSTYWVNFWRYPSKGGFFTYTHSHGAHIEYGRGWCSRTRKSLLGFQDGAATFDAGIDAGSQCSSAAPRMLHPTSARPPRKESDTAPPCARGRKASIRKRSRIRTMKTRSAPESAFENFSPFNAPKGMTAMSMVCGFAAPRRSEYRRRAGPTRVNRHGFLRARGRDLGSTPGTGDLRSQPTEA